MQETIAISKFKATCLHLLDNVKKTGRSILVTRKGEPIALITPPPPPPKPETWLGSLKDSIEIVGDIVSPVIDEREWEVLMAHRDGAEDRERKTEARMSGRIGRLIFYVA